MKIFYFSATGNSLHLALSLGGKALSVVRCMEDNACCYKDDVIGFVFPIHFGQVAPPMIEFVKMAQLEARYLFFIGTYGHYAANALRQFEALLETKGLKADYGCDVEMVDSWLPRYAIENERALLPRRRVEEHILQIRRDIEARKTRSVSYSAIATVASFFGQRQKYRNICSNFEFQGQCNSCGVCQDVCSQHNILLQGGRPHFGEACISCLACVHWCPQNVIHLKNEKSGARFHHAGVSLRQMMGRDGGPAE